MSSVEHETERKNKSVTKTKTKKPCLKDISFLKSLATSETPLTVQAKGVQGVQVMLSVRSICFSNGSPQSLNDKSDGWSRRLLILSVKPVPPDRIIDRTLSDKLLAEKEGIFLWMFEGLQQLIKNKFEFARSEKLQQNLVDMREDGCNIIGYLKDTQFIEYDKNAECSTAALYKNYCGWCTVNGQIALKKDTFSV